jgi:hypothetical protein
MAKFYVQSGTVRAVIDAESQDRAALWVVHRAMQQIMPIYDDNDLSAQQKCDNALVEGMLGTRCSYQVERSRLRST